jgi:hypothetical protein
MNNKFNELPWHDSELLGISIDRSNAGINDVVKLTIRWPEGKISDLLFEDVYLLDAKMNFGVVALESILEGSCFNESEQISTLRNIWEPLGVKLDELQCYRIITNSTNSRIDVYALSFSIL